MALTVLLVLCGPCFQEHVWASVCATRSTNSRANWSASQPRYARGYAPSSTPCCTGVDSAKAYGWWQWASACVTLPIASTRRWMVYLQLTDNSRVGACGTIVSFHHRDILPGMNAGASLSAVPSPIEGSGTA